MAIGKPNRKSLGSNTSVGGPPAPKTPDNKRKSLPKNMPSGGNKRPAPAAAASPAVAKKPFLEKQKQGPPPPKQGSPQKQQASPQKQGISHQLNKVSEQSKTISKKNKKQNKQKKGPSTVDPSQKDKKGPHADNAKRSKKNRQQRLQAKLSAKPRSPLSQSRALKAEQELNKSSNRILFVRLPDPVIASDTIKGWSPAIESALFQRPMEPRSFLVVLKPDANVKKEIETLKKVTVGTGKLHVEERKDTVFQGKAEDGLNPSDLVDPYTLYVTNLDEGVTREELQAFYPKAKTVMNPRKHNPRVSGGGTGTKFAFVGFETAEEALEAFKTSFNKEFKGGRFVVVRFRRINKEEVKKAKADEAKSAVTPAVAKKAEGQVAKTQEKKKEEPKAAAAAAKKGKLIKEEPVEDDQEDSDEEDDEEDDDDDQVEVGEGSDDDEDDDDDDLEEDDDDDDEDEDDDEDDD